MEIIIENRIDNNLFEEVAFYNGMLGEFSYNPKEFCITFAEIGDKQTDVLRYIGKESVIHIPDGVMAVPYLLQEGYDTHSTITIVNHSRNLIDMDYMLFRTNIHSVILEGFAHPVCIRSAENAFADTKLQVIDMTSVNVATCTNMVRMFANTGLTGIDLSGIYLKNDANLQYMFADCTHLQEVKFFNNGTNEKLVLNMQDALFNCSQLSDLHFFDADEFQLKDYEGDIRRIVPEVCPLFRKLNTFVAGFVPEFTENVGIQLNEAFDIKFINEYSMLLRKSTPKDILNCIAFIMRLLQELKLEEYGTSSKVSKIHFVRSIAKVTAVQELSGTCTGKILFVQPRALEDTNLTVYALYYKKDIKGYRIKYKNNYYDVTPTEYVQLGLTGIMPSKKLKLTFQQDEFFVRQTQGEIVPIFGFDELKNVLEGEE